MQTPLVIMIYHSPAHHHQGLEALNYVREALQAGRDITQVFFYGPGTLYANCFLDAPPGQSDLQQQWQTLARDNQLPLVMCATAGAQYGVSAALPPAGNLAEHFQPGGLTEFSTTLTAAVELVQF